MKWLAIEDADLEAWEPEIQKVFDTL